MVIITHSLHSGKLKLQILSLLQTLWVKMNTASLNLRYHTVPALYTTLHNTVYLLEGLFC